MEILRQSVILKNKSINIINIKLGIEANIYLEWGIKTTEKSYLRQNLDW